MNCHIGFLLCWRMERWIMARSVCPPSIIDMSQYWLRLVWSMLILDMLVEVPSSCCFEFTLVAGVSHALVSRHHVYSQIITSRCPIITQITVILDNTVLGFEMSYHRWSVEQHFTTLCTLRSFVSFNFMLTLQVFFQTSSTVGLSSDNLKHKGLV